VIFVSIMETTMTHHVQVGIPNPLFAHGGGHKVEATVGINHAPSIIHCICIAMCVCVCSGVYEEHREQREKHREKREQRRIERA